MHAVRAWSEPVVLPTHEPDPPDPHPVFPDRPGGGPYPLAPAGRIAENPVPRAWQALHIENEFLYAMVLPELGGRVHIARDKTRACDFLYRQDLIKPALTGRDGPGLCGGLEFGWPGHPRPGAFLPVDWSIEEEPGGGRILWLGDHDPLSRMKALAGVRLRPGVARLDLLVRLHNRTRLPQPFRWWVSASVRVHEHYQVFLPPDARRVVDDTGAVSAFPLGDTVLGGVDFAARARHGVPAAERPEAFAPPRDERDRLFYPPNDLSWYANLPAALSYSALDTRAGFLGGYDHARQTGVVHVADPRLLPGKRIRTRGNHESGRAWDRRLSSDGAPAMELMAGAQEGPGDPAGLLLPGETRAWTQGWYPIHDIGAPCAACEDAAMSLALEDPRARLARIGVCVTRPIPGAAVRLDGPRGLCAEFLRDLAPGAPLVETVPLPRGAAPQAFRLSLHAEGREILAWRPPPPVRDAAPADPSPPSAAELPPSLEEIYLAGARRERDGAGPPAPESFWRAALRRDPGDARCNHALGLLLLRRGEWPEAARHFRAVLSRLGRGDDGGGASAHLLGVCLCFQADALPAGDGDALREEARDAFDAAARDPAWRAPALRARAELDCRRGDWAAAVGALRRSLLANGDDNGAQALLALALERAGAPGGAAVAEDLLRKDPLDAAALWLFRGIAPDDFQIRADIAHDLARAGLYDRAHDLLHAGWSPASWTDPRNRGVLAQRDFLLAWLHHRAGDAEDAREHVRRGASAGPEFLFPRRLEDIAVLLHAVRLIPHNDCALTGLGNLLYARGAHAAAMRMWRQAARNDPDNAAAWRNLGLGYHQIRNDPDRACAAYNHAVRAAPGDPLLLAERDRLWRRIGVRPARRLAVLEGRPDLTAARDDLCVELAALYNQTGQYGRAAEVIAGRNFQPRADDPGRVLAEHVRASLGLGREALRDGDPEAAARHFHHALRCPHNLGEARPLLADRAELHFALGEALAAGGDRGTALLHWKRAADAAGDPRAGGERPPAAGAFFSALALRRLGRNAAARALLRELLATARRLAKKAVVEYEEAAPSPEFCEDPEARRKTRALFLEAQARTGLGQRAAGRRLLGKVLELDPNHPGAADFLAFFACPS